MQDIAEELVALQMPPMMAFDAPNSGASVPNIQENPVLGALGFDPVGLDTLSARTGWDVATLQAQLLDWELEGLVARLPGGLFQRQRAA